MKAPVLYSAAMQLAIAVPIGGFAPRRGSVVGNPEGIFRDRHFFAVVFAKDNLKFEVGKTAYLE